MANRVLLTYVVADLLFVMVGAVMMGFSIIVQNTIYEAATTGGQAARNLLYQKFPITGMCHGQDTVTRGVFTDQEYRRNIPQE